MPLHREAKLINKTTDKIDRQYLLD